MVGTASDPCFREAGRTCCLGTATQVEPPGQREAGGIEREIDHQCELRAAGDRDRLAEATRDQIAAAGADRADEAQRRTALDTGRLQGSRTAGVAGAAGFAQIFLAE